MSAWAVVHYSKRGPLVVEGPYPSRADAESLRQDCLADPDTTPGVRSRVVRVYNTIAPREIERFGWPR